MASSDDDARYPPIPSRRRPSSSSRRPPSPSSDEQDDYSARRPASPSSSDSRGKRRRLDNYEFAPRVPLPPPPAPRASTSEWTDLSTSLLLEAWGARFLANGRKSIRSDEWADVAKTVAQALPRSDAQCRNRLDTLKKKYRKEKARIAEGLAPDSTWPYFNKMDELMQSPSAPPMQPLRQQPPRHAPPPRRHEYIAPPNRGNGVVVTRRPSPEPEEDASEEDESDGPPPRVTGSEASFRMLANSIKRFSDLYERTESRKRQQMAELERMRKDFQRDLEAHKRQILERAHVEIMKIREEYGEEDEEEERSAEENNDDEIDGST